MSLSSTSTPTARACRRPWPRLTGRKTVPNVLVNGQSIGGGDEVVELDHDDKLADKIKRLGNKRVQVSERFTPGSNNL